MAYTKLNLKDGDDFDAAACAHIESGIAQNAKDITDLKTSSDKSVTETKVNELIDAKLGVIENGTY